MITSAALALGFMALALIALCILWLLGELIWAAVVTASLMRWQFAVVAHNGGEIRWKKLPKIVLSRYVDSVGFRTGSVTCSSDAGYWDGVGAWEAWKVDPK